MDQQPNNNSIPVKIKKKTAVKKSRAAGKKKKITKESYVKKQALSDDNIKPAKRGLLATVMAVITVAAIVGIGIFVWQKEVIKKNVGEVKKEADSSKIDFENRLLNLKDKLTGVESENTELKTTNEELKEKAELLAIAKMEFSNSELGIAFEYPAILGEVNLSISDEGGEKKFTGRFSDNDKLIFGGVSADYGKSGATTSAAFIDALGFSKKKGKYYYRSPSADYEIQPANIIKLGNGGEALIVDKNSFGDKEQNAGIGEDIGALFNLNNKDFSGLVFLNQDLGRLSLIDFGAMLETMEIK
ncbi:hypothetical protein KKF23_00075 [Patescibacteria group bacterium]|nr:hypothetical protein [Patescibacteria group bacterium]